MRILGTKENVERERQGQPLAGTTVGGSRSSSETSREEKVGTDERPTTLTMASRVVANDADTEEEQPLVGWD